MKKFYLLLGSALLAAQVSFAQGYTPGEGNGLTGSYWKGATNFDQDEPEIYWGKRPQGTHATKEFERVDPVIDFEWGNGNPFDDTDTDFPFCIEWTGYVLAPVTSSYTFDFTVWDNGFYFDIFDLDSPDTPIGHHEFWGTDFKWDQPDWVCDVDLEGGKFYKVVIRHYEDDFGAHARMSWYIWETGDSQIVPQTQLYTKLPELSVIGEKEISTVGLNTVKGGIEIYNLNGENVSVYNPTGQNVYSSANAAGRIRVDLKSGVYLVKAGETSYKVMVP